MLLCDHAQEVNGKLYILGGGWSLLFVANQPIPVTVAVKLAVPWDRSNRQMPLACRLLNEDGEAVAAEGAEGGVRAEGIVEAGRPPGLKPGTPLDIVLALPFVVSLPAGGYVFELEVDGERVSRAPFRVQGNTMQQR